jgi:hypothetical protein
MRTILAKLNILANAFEKDGNIETAELLHNVFIKISKKKKKKKSGKNVPNNPSLWAQCKAQAKQKFDVYPSAYANGWAAKQYKAKGGTWRKASFSNTRLAQEDGAEILSPQVIEEQKDIKEKQTPLSPSDAGEKLKNFILSESGDFQYLKARADDFIQTLNVNSNTINDLKNYAIYIVKLKVNEPSLDQNLYNDAHKALMEAKSRLEVNEINTYTLGKINNYLRKKVQRRQITPKVYFTALEMSRLKSTGQAPTEA